MIFLGLLLVLLAAGSAILVLSEESARYILFGYTFQPNHVEMFLVGAATTAALFLGLWLITAGTRRTAKRRRELLHARHNASNKVAKLENEKRELQRKLEREKAAKDHADDHTDHVGNHARTDTRTDDRLVAGRPGEHRR